MSKVAYGDQPLSVPGQGTRNRGLSAPIKAVIGVGSAAIIIAFASLGAIYAFKPDSVAQTSVNGVKQVVELNTNNLETMITGTPTPTTSTIEQKAIITWENSNLTYQKGTTYWEVNVGNGIEKVTPEWLQLTDKDFFIKDAFEDEKGRYVIAWGKTLKNEFFGKVVFIDKETHVQKSSYVLEMTRIYTILALYDVPTGNELTDLLVLLGEANDSNTISKARVATKQVGTTVPVIRVLQFNEEGGKLYKSVLVVPDYGTVPSGDAVRNKGGDFTVNIEAVTRSDPSGIKYSINTNDFPNLKNGTPIFQLR